MSSATLLAPKGAAPLTWRSALAAWRGITPRQAWLALGFGIFCFLYDQGALLQMMVHTPGFRGRPFLLTLTCLGDVLAACGLMGCIAIAERTDGPRTRHAIYLVAIVASAAIAGLLKLIPRSGTFMFSDDPGRTFALVQAAWAGFFQWLIIGGAGTFVYVDSRRARAARERLHAAELERSHAAKRTLESRLQAMQARVEPRFLFNTLAQVEALYRTSAARAERMLDQLIAYLRAAMPRMRDTASALAQELDLVRAYLGIVQAGLGEQFHFAVDPPAPAIADVRVPPMMLLPLVERALALVGPTTPPIARCITLTAGADGATLTIEIADSASGFAERDDESVDGVRERLAALYGARARLTLDTRAGSTAAILALPMEAA